MEVKLSNRKYNFYIENDFLIIKKRLGYLTKEVKKIKCSSIVEVEYKSPYKGLNFIRIILYYLFSVVFSIFLLTAVGEKKSWKKYLEISYFVDGDKGVFKLDIELNQKDLLKLKKHLIW